MSSDTTISMMSQLYISFVPQALSFLPCMGVSENGSPVIICPHQCGESPSTMQSEERKSRCLTLGSDS